MASCPARSPASWPLPDESYPHVNAPRLRSRGAGRTAGRYRTGVPESFDVDAMLERFRSRAAAVRRRGVPPVEGDERRRIMEQMQLDYMDFAILGDASGELADGVLTLRVDLRPPPAEASPSGSAAG